MQRRIPIGRIRRASMRRRKVDRSRAYLHSNVYPNGYENRCNVRPTFIYFLFTGDLVGIHPVLSFEMGGHAVNSPVFIMGAANDKPALRSAFFYYRTLNRRSRGVVSLRVQLLRVFDGGQTRPVEKPISLRLQPSAAPEILTPVCIQLSSRQPEFFRSRIELKFTVPDSNTFEIRRLDTSQTDVCISK